MCVYVWVVGVDVVYSHHFLHCNVTSYQSQCALFTRALSLSPTNTLHTVIANAGVGEVGDFIQPSSSPDSDPPEPDLTTLDVNVKGVIYTSKLALHHFRRNNNSSCDSHLLLVGSMASFFSSPGVVSLYTASKHAVLGLFRTLRLHPGNHAKHVRVNIICPYFVDTPIIPTMGKIMLSGVELARSEDVVEAAARLVCEPCARGRALVVAPRSAGGVLEMDVQTMQDVDAFARRIARALNARGYVETALRCVADLCRIFFFGGRLLLLPLLGVAGLVAALVFFSPLSRPSSSSSP
jgi:NAD(P)-dependent dehydrogenase (short-subunit alcohol dehydrogenase family)